MAVSLINSAVICLVVLYFHWIYTFAVCRRRR